MKTNSELREKIDRLYGELKNNKGTLDNPTMVRSNQVLALFEVLYEEMFDLQRQIINLEVKCENKS